MTQLPLAPGTEHSSVPAALPDNSAAFQYFSAVVASLSQPSPSQAPAPAVTVAGATPSPPGVFSLEAPRLGRYVGVTIMALNATTGISAGSMKKYKLQALAIAAFNEMLQSLRFGQTFPTAGERGLQLGWPRFRPRVALCPGILSLIRASSAMTTKNGCYPPYFIVVVNSLDICRDASKSNSGLHSTFVVNNPKQKEMRTNWGVTDHLEHTPATGTQPICPYRSKLGFSKCPRHGALVSMACPGGWIE
ncbi:hypothetical protein B0H16DRAFT_1474043 [Mycena metata]|uniref:Uncharacterized protein n=1 Tax=Mycena metata TaxID=1033252 RepID=A0AAD7HHV0_9AGAR|nr:hypothetical protein B0H16DRAFT_1474043 [Mycena metata]